MKPSNRLSHLVGWKWLLAAAQKVANMVVAMFRACGVQAKLAKLVKLVKPSVPSSENRRHFFNSSIILTAAVCCESADG